MANEHVDVITRWRYCRDNIDTVQKKDNFNLNAGQMSSDFYVDTAVARALTMITLKISAKVVTTGASTVTPAVSLLEAVLDSMWVRTAHGEDIMYFNNMSNLKQHIVSFNGQLIETTVPLNLGSAASPNVYAIYNIPIWWDNSKGQLKLQFQARTVFTDGVSTYNNPNISMTYQYAPNTFPGKYFEATSKGLGNKLNTTGWVSINRDTPAKIVELIYWTGMAANNDWYDQVFGAHYPVDATAAKFSEVRYKGPDYEENKDWHVVVTESLKFFSQHETFGYHDYATQASINKVVGLACSTCFIEHLGARGQLLGPDVTRDINITTAETGTINGLFICLSATDDYPNAGAVGPAAPQNPQVAVATLTPDTTTTLISQRPASVGIQSAGTRVVKKAAPKRFGIFGRR